MQVFKDRIMNRKYIVIRIVYAIVVVTTVYLFFLSQDPDPNSFIHNPLGGVIYLFNVILLFCMSVVYIWFREMNRHPKKYEDLSILEHTSQGGEPSLTVILNDALYAQVKAATKPRMTSIPQSVSTRPIVEDNLLICRGPRSSDAVVVCKAIGANQNSVIVQRIGGTSNGE